MSNRIRFSAVLAFIVIALMLTFVSRAEAVTDVEIDSSYDVSRGNVPLYFIDNKGQLDEKIKYYEIASDHGMFFTEDGVYVSLRNGAKDELIKLKFNGISSASSVDAEGLLDGQVSFFSGKDSEKWLTGIPTYKSVVYKGVYDGIDVKLYGNNKQLEYDIIVAPGVDPTVAKLSYEGIQGLSVKENGELEIELKYGTIVHKRPYIYQEINGERVEVDGSFKVYDKGGLYGFEVAAYDASLPLVIDPILSYSTYLGGSSDDRANSVAVDSAGNIYVAGYTSSFDFLPSSQVFGVPSGLDYAYVAKFDPSGSSLIYSAYFGGSGTEEALALSIDSSGSAVIGGYTSSFDFPVISPAIQELYPGSAKSGFVLKLNASGSALDYSTYLGGIYDDSVTGIALDNSGNAYVTGDTGSFDFPYTAGVFQSSLSGPTDAFVVKIDPAGAGLVYSSFLGGVGPDEGRDITVDSSGSAYIAGVTYSMDFPEVNEIPFMVRSAPAVSDGFFTKVSPDGSSLLISSYLGGEGADSPNGIAIDGSENIYIAGETDSWQFPLVDPISSHMRISEAFVTKVAAGGGQIIYSTYIGGCKEDSAEAIAVEPMGSVYITGTTYSGCFPVQYPLMGYRGEADVFVTKLNAAGTDYVYSTFLGDNWEDFGRDIFINGNGDTYVSGSTYSYSFPMGMVGSPFDWSYNELEDGFLSVISELSPDSDGDGYGTDLDCDDTEFDINPGAPEICGDGIDNNCSGSDLTCPVYDLAVTNLTVPDSMRECTKKSEDVLIDVANIGDWPIFVDVTLERNGEVLQVWPQVWFFAGETDTFTYSYLPSDTGDTGTINWVATATIAAPDNDPSNNSLSDVTVLTACGGGGGRP